MKKDSLIRHLWRTSLLSCITLLASGYFASPLSAQSFERYWGTNYEDKCHEVQVTQDSGFIMIGQTTHPSLGEQMLLVKTDRNGNLQWQKTIGSGGDQIGRSVKQTNSGDYVVFGTTTGYPPGGVDYLFAKLDPSGNVIWSWVYGGSYDEYASKVYVTNNGGYLLVGSSASYTASAPNGTYRSAHIIKTDGVGNFQWTRWIGGDASFGGPGIDGALAALESGSGEFLITGYMSSYGSPGGGAPPASRDIFLARLSSIGNVLSLNTYGTNTLQDDEGVNILQSPLGGYLISGTVDQFPGGNGTPVVVQTNVVGTHVKTSAFKGNGSETGKTLTSQFANGGSSIQLGGWTTDYGAGQKDYFFAQTDINLTMFQGSTSYGGTLDDEFSFMDFTPTNEIIQVGHTQNFRSPNTDNDLFLVQTNAAGAVHNSCNSSSAFTRLQNVPIITAGIAPTIGTGPSFGYLTAHSTTPISLLGDTVCGVFPGMALPDTGTGLMLSYQDSLPFYPEAICNTAGGGFAITGYSTRPSINRESFILNAASDGTVNWIRLYGRIAPVGGSQANDYGRSIAQTPDMGFVVLGETQTTALNSNVWFLQKTYPDGTIEWVHEYQGSLGKNEIPKKVIPINSGYICVGGTGQHGLSGTGIKVMKTNLSGIGFWTTTIGGNAGRADVANDVIEDPATGDIYITGRTNGYGYNQEDIFLAKINVVGTLVWFKTYGYYRSDAGLTLKKVGNEIVIGATARPLGTDRDPTILVTDLNGNYKRIVSFLGSPSDFADRGVSVEAVNGGNDLVFSGWTSSFGGGDRDAFQAQVNIGLTSLNWAYVYNLNNRDDMKAMVISPTQDHRILCASQSPSGNSSWDIVLHNTDKNGEMESGCEAPIIPQLYSFAPTTYSPSPTNQTIMAPTTNMETFRTDTLIVDFDTLCGYGNSLRLATLEEAVPAVNEEALSEVKVFPNPFNGDLTFAWSQATDSKVHIAVFNTQGKVVWQEQKAYPRGQNQEQLPDLGLSDGLYLYSITVKGETLRGKVVKTQ